MEQKAQRGKSGRDETQGIERIKSERVKRGAFADGGGKIRMMANEEWEGEPWRGEEKEGEGKGKLQNDKKVAVSKKRKTRARSRSVKEKEGEERGGAGVDV